MSLTWGRVRIAPYLLALLAAVLLAYAAFLVFNIPDPTPGFWDRIYNVIEFLAAGICLLRGLTEREERRGWILLGLGMLCFAFGDVYWTFVLKHKDRTITEVRFPHSAIPRHRTHRKYSRRATSTC